MDARLLHIVDSLENDPQNATFATLSQHLVQQPLRVSVLSMTGAGPLVEPLRQAGIDVHWVEPPVRHLAQLVLKLRRKIQVLQPDIVHTWSEQANRLGRLAAASVRVPTLIASCRHMPRRLSLATRLLELPLARVTENYVANSECCRALCEKVLWQKPSVSQHKLRVIADGVDCQESSTADERSRVRSQLGLPDDAKLVGTFGPLTSGRGLKDVIWATDLLRVYYPHIYLLIVGQGPCRWRLERYATQIRATERVRFLGNRSDWGPLIGALDCLCQPSQRDSIPMAALEAMARGVAVVASDIPGHRELLASGQTGLLVGVGNRGQLARTLQQVLDDRSHAERLGSAARQFVRRKHRVAEMVDQYAELYLGRRPCLEVPDPSWRASSPSIP